MRHEGKHLQAVAVRDRLLQLVAKRMTDTVREADIVARVGGDEFVVAAQFSRDIPSSFDEDAVDVIDATARLARRLVAVLEEPFDLGDAGIPVLVGASVGVAVPLWRDEGRGTAPQGRYGDVPCKGGWARLLPLFRARDGCKHPRAP